jgi:hypothetical protein
MKNLRKLKDASKEQPHYKILDRVAMARDNGG